MKPDDKLPEEMLEDIRVAAIKARDALEDLDFALGELGRISPTFRPARVAMWKAGVADMARKSNAIANVAEELADAEDETAEGGEE